MTANSNMQHWDALKTTDPKYTKPVTFGRKFTSINSQWQLQRMTEQFGPIGHGWGYTVEHNIERIADEYVLAIADVTIWWGNPVSMKVYGPVRGMSPIVEKTKNGLHFDDDAGKKAMTDALTKGLSHLGLSADVFLGLFDDNKYVQNVREQFANGNAPQPENPLPEEDRHLLKNGETRSTYRVAADAVPPGRAMAEFWAANAILLFQQDGYDQLQYADWKGQPCTPKGTKTNKQKLDELSEKHPDLADKIYEALDALPVAK